MTARSGLGLATQPQQTAHLVMRETVMSEWTQYAYVSGLGPNWLAPDYDPTELVSVTDFESESEREEREASELGNYDPSHGECDWHEFCIFRVMS